MPNGIDIDFSQLKPAPDFVGGYVNAFRAGQELGKASALQNARPPQNPQGAAPGQDRAAMIAQARATNEQLAHILLGLKQYAPGQRLGIAQHLARATGLLDPAAITPDDVTDQGIDAHLAQALSVEQFLKQQGGQTASQPPSNPSANPAAPPDGSNAFDPVDSTRASEPTPATNALQPDIPPASITALTQGPTAATGATWGNRPNRDQATR